MPRPEPNFVTFEIDGREVRAPEGMTLLDAAKEYGDVEIPYFCYERKLGQAIGACRMCTVEVEGMGLDISCSLTVEEGMVVWTTSAEVRRVQNANVEFLLVNHPLDCPVCDKGGECPLQDISFGWGLGHSRFIEPKRHFKKPLELSPLIAIDRERCILCYRCIRFSQEVAEDYQLVFLERADTTYVGTHDGRPYVAPFSGNIIELCPVGALTSSAYRFRARPWDIEDSGSVCTLCPSQCNIRFTVRDDDKVMRVLGRDNYEVDDGWLCDKGRFGYQAIHAPERITEPMVQDAGALRAVSWERAMSEAVAGLERAGARTAALVGGEATNEEGFLLQRLMRDALGSPHVDSRTGGPLDPEHARALARPDLTATVSDIDHAGTVVVLGTELIEESPILDLRVRKAKRRNRVRVVVVSSRAGMLDPNADAIVRCAPGAEEAALAALVEALGTVRPDEPPPVEVEPEDPSAPPDRRLLDDAFGESGDRGEGSGVAELDDLARRAGATPVSVTNAAGLLRGTSPTVVLWGERITHGRRGRQTTAALLALAEALGVPEIEGSGLIEVPQGTNGRGLREVGCLPDLRPGLADADSQGPGAGQPAPVIARALGHELRALVLLGADPLRTHPDREAWRQALEHADFVLAFADFPSELTEHADVVLPLESYAEKEGTVTHPDGRIQRVRQAIPHLNEGRPTWSVLVELSERLGAPPDPPLVTSPMVTAAVAEAVPFYGGLTLEEIGGQGVRWPEREAASALPAAELPREPLETPPEHGLPGEAARDALRLGTVTSLWTGNATDFSPILRFLSPRQRVELSAEDARALGIAPGDEVEVQADGTRVRGLARVRDAVAPGTLFLVEGTADQNATALLNGAPRAVRVAKVPESERVLEQPRGEGARATREVHEPRAGGQSGVEVSPA